MSVVDDRLSKSKFQLIYVIKNMEELKMKDVVIVSGVRLPVGSYGGSLKSISAIDMGASCKRSS